MASTCFAGSDEGGIAGVSIFKELQRIAVEESLGIPMIFGRDVILVIIRYILFRWLWQALLTMSL